MKKPQHHRFIHPCTSPWGSLIFFLSKNYGSLLFCIDYGAPNHLAVKNVYSQLRVDVHLDQVGAGQYLSMIDLGSEYHQMRIASEDTSKTAFRNSYGYFEYIFVPLEK